jgi:hypothetical protein
LSRNNTKTKSTKFNQPDENLHGNNIKSLTGYNIFSAINGGNFNLLDFTFDTTYVYEGAETGILHEFFVTALYDEGESFSSDTVSVIISLTEEKPITGILFLPNPAKDIVQINSTKQIQKIMLFDANGKMVKRSDKINKTSLNLDISDLKPGLYTMSIITSEKMVYCKLVVN